MCNPITIFGYGSLMFPEGINGRGLFKHYEDKDLRLAVLPDYKRSLCARGQKPYFGIEHSPGSGNSVRGVTFEIDRSDWYAFWNSECGDAVYDYIPVIVFCDCGSVLEAITCVPKDPKPAHRSQNQRYVDFCIQGVLNSWGWSEMEKFIASTDLVGDGITLPDIASLVR